MEYLLFSVHRYESLTTDGVHEMKFSSIRLDNLVQRLVSPGEMTETFERRPDSLYYRRVNFGRHVQFSEEHGTSEPAARVLQVQLCKQEVEMSTNQMNMDIL